MQTLAARWKKMTDAEKAHYKQQAEQAPTKSRAGSGRNTAPASATSATTSVTIFTSDSTVVC